MVPMPVDRRRAELRSALDVRRSSTAHQEAWHVDCPSSLDAAAWAEWAGRDGDVEVCDSSG